MAPLVLRPVNVTVVTWTSSPSDNPDRIWVCPPELAPVVTVVGLRAPSAATTVTVEVPPDLEIAAVGTVRTSVSCL